MGNTPVTIGAPLEWAVHPHTRGEHWSGNIIVKLHDGSSPHPWGTPHGPVQGQLKARFIPTPVGNTLSSVLFPAGLSVHPHTRGEHEEHNYSPVRILGSSPHPWGTLMRTGNADVKRRFIPTPVGNTSRFLATVRPVTVHPHTRGEHSAASWLRMSLPGSSPHPWGTHFDKFQKMPYLRFIPTPVGNTPSSRPACSVITVHPHTRGEHTNKC